MSNNNLLNIEKERRQAAAKGIYSTLNKIVLELDLEIDSSDKKTLLNYRNAVIEQLKEKIGNKKKVKKQENIKKIECPICNKRLKSSHSLKNHMRDKHGMNEGIKEKSAISYPNRVSNFDYHNDYNSVK